MTTSVQTVALMNFANDLIFMSLALSILTASLGNFIQQL
ncbi:hypothetical protein SPSINT_1432 [Staphylococcus pseudintermedius HKU10-03]|nr:hypothetical protein SPSINT_1432 [Staphylococcus pseudintermedius HKU10-03]ANS89334.1 hypothetical protein A6M57_5080 [Staphylococcus pseudintermedius]